MVQLQVIPASLGQPRLLSTHGKPMSTWAASVTVHGAVISSRRGVRLADCCGSQSRCDAASRTKR